MKKSGWRLIISVALLMAWLGYLAYLAATTTDPIVLSRSQFLTADVYLVAYVGSASDQSGRPSDEVTVKSVAWSAVADAKLVKLKVVNLASVDSGRGWQGAGEYILALSRPIKGEDVFELTPLPRTPGFAGAPGRIYLATSTTLRQMELLTNQFHRQHEGR